MRPSRRQPDELRPVSLERAVVKYAEGSCFVKFGETHVLVTATLEDRLPPGSLLSVGGLGLFTTLASESDAATPASGTTLDSSASLTLASAVTQGLNDTSSQLGLAAASMVIDNRFWAVRKYGVKRENRSHIATKINARKPTW